MKIFKEENGKEVVYVQMQDIRFINSTYDTMPESIYMKVFGDGLIIGNRNRFDYVRFENKNDVHFFKEVDYIIDYNEFKNLSLEEIEEKGKELETTIGNIIEVYTGMSEEEKIKKTVILQDFEKLKYKMHWLNFIYGQKKDKEDLPLPNQAVQRIKKFPI